MALNVNAYAQTQEKHSVSASWNYFGFNSTYSKNSDKKTFGTIGITYGYRFNKLISVNGNVGWSHSWFKEGATPSYAYPKKDNAILILAGCNVDWFHKGMIHLHSGVAGGVDIRVQTNDRGSYSTVGLAGQLDAIGLTLDLNRLFIDLTSGWGSMGCIRFGVGYNF